MTKLYNIYNMVLDTMYPRIVNVVLTRHRIKKGGITKMSFLNLMGNKLKPKEVNEVLEELTNAIGQLNNIVSSLQTPTASNVTYDNTASGLNADDVQNAIDEVNSKIKNWVLIESNITSESDPVNVANYSELYIIPKAQGIGKSAPLYCPNFQTFTIGNSYREGNTYSLDYSVIVSSDSLTVAYNIAGWTSVTFDIYGK